MTAAGAQNWTTLAVSADMSRIFASYGAYTVPSVVYYSWNGGASWSSSGTSDEWVGLACSWDGSHVFGTIYNGGNYCYLSADGAQTWNTTYPSGTYGASWAWWGNVAVSSNGNIIWLVNSGDGSLNISLFYSPNFGTTWNNLPLTWWSAVAYSADNSTLLITSDDGSAISLNLSIDNGATYTLLSVPPAGSIVFALSADGSRMIAADYGGYLYISTNRGSTWAVRLNDTARVWGCVDISADGMRMAACDNGGGTGGYIWISTNGGATWVQSASPLGNWYKVVIQK